MLLTAFQQRYYDFGFQRPDILEGPVDFAAIITASTWILGEVTGNSSWVDRLWTFLPPLYSAYYTFLPLLSTAPLDIQVYGVKSRALLMLAAQVIWSTRLSYNTYRRGLFNLKDEDYRWAILRKHLPGVLYKIFSLIFIALMQHALLFGLGIPAYKALLQPDGLELTDICLFCLSVFTVIIQFVSDNQQWAYHQFKHTGSLQHDEQWPGSRLNFTANDRKRGFVANGLWSLSRHPNFLCEQTFWLLNACYPVFASFYQPRLVKTIPSCDISSLATHLKTGNHQYVKYCVSESGVDLWPLLSSLTVIMLFQGSTFFTEFITAGKYPEYKAYKARVGMFSPISTFLKGLWLGILGRKEETESIVWGKKASMKTE